jgi:hypothetical protein
MQAIAVSQLKNGDTVIGISQSGASKDIVESMKVARSHGARTIAITSRERSPIARCADVVLLTVKRGIRQLQIVNGTADKLKIGGKHGSEEGGGNGNALGLEGVNGSKRVDIQIGLLNSGMIGNAHKAVGNAVDGYKTQHRVGAVSLGGIVGSRYGGASVRPMSSGLVGQTVSGRPYGKIRIYRYKRYCRCSELHKFDLLFGYIFYYHLVYIIIQ